MPVIKSNAYGHGFKEVAKICVEHKEINRICVASLEEALELLKINRNKPVLILSFYELDEKKLRVAIKQGVIFPLYSLRQAEFLNKVAKKIRKQVMVHLKVDTGTSRVGILPEEVPYFIRKLKKFSYLYLEGLWSHFAASEEDKEFTLFQLKRFKELTQKLEEQGIHIPLKHFACTASTILYPESHLNAVRIGLGMYGLYPSTKISKKIILKPALTLNTKIIQVKKIPKFTRVSYGGEWEAPQATTLCVIPCGYFDGFDRRLSNNTSVLIKGKKFPLRGRICMNLAMIDVGNKSNIKVGDTVTIIGKQLLNKITPEELAQKISTINYEIISRINPLIPRIYI
jgi:alanine racemase